MTVANPPPTWPVANREMAQRMQRVKTSPSNPIRIALAISFSKRPP